MSSLSSKAVKKVVKELQGLKENPPEDIQLVINDQDLSEIIAWIRGPDGTPYQGGYFKIRLTLDESFPDTPPKGYFMTKIFHPNVSSNGEICVNTLKKDWKPELGIEHILLTIKCLLIVPNPESALNEEAGKLLLEAYDDYANRAKLYTSIQATSGKADYLALCKNEDQENQKEENSSSNKRENEDSSSKSEEQQPVKKLKVNNSASSSKAAKKKKTLRRL
ncbi:hypothetical protein K501DRAFT_253928 [Backusella circina FSU 941]|nr:hypothetical protein K501DRAFT_253928 [Backusella circina FSU 941]